MHQVVGTRRADRDERRGPFGGDELPYALGRVDREQLGPLGGHGAADRRQQLAQQIRAPGGAAAAAEARRVARALVDERDGLVDHADRALVGLLRAVAPHDEPVLGQHDELQVRVGAGRLADLLGEREARPDVGDPGRGVAEALAHEPLPVGRAGEHVDPVRMRVVHVRRGDERVQQRLDRAARHRRVELAARQVGDHLLVAHRLALDQREHLLEPEPGEVLLPHRRQVGARALDPHHGHLAAGVIARRALGRRVAAAEVGDRAVRAQQVRRVDELGEDVIPRRRGTGVPQVLDVIDQRGDGAHVGISCRDSRSAATRSA